MIIVLIFLVLITAYLYIMSNKTYKSYVESVDKKEYPLKDLLCIGLYLLDICKYSFSLKYDRKIYSKLGELTDYRNLAFHQRIHMANKIVFTLLVLFFEIMISFFLKADMSYFAFCLALLVGLFFVLDAELDKKISKRKLELQLDFPDFVNKLLLLVNTGMSIGRAWERASQDGSTTRPLYKELGEVSIDLTYGKSERQAYEDFAKRCRIPEVTKFVSIIIQNLRKGNSELVPVLRLVSTECWQMRKTAAKNLGEQASTKLLLPMAIMFIAILIIVILPAIMAMQGGI